MAGQPTVFSMCYGPSVFVLGTPGSSEAIASPGNHSGVRQLTGSMGLSLEGWSDVAKRFAFTIISNARIIITAIKIGFKKLIGTPPVFFNIIA